jgi:hypothetical protein
MALLLAALAAALLSQRFHACVWNSVHELGAKYEGAPSRFQKVDVFIF